jgi:restriction endonuclease S subunit
LNLQAFNKFIKFNIDSNSAQPNISTNSILRYQFFLPNLGTQQQIIDIIEPIERVIAVVEKIVNSLEQLLINRNLGHESIDSFST